MAQENIPLQSGEEIKSVQGYEGLYSITLFGRVWSHERYSLQKHKLGGKFLVNNFSKTTKYLQVILWREGVSRKFLTHILVATHFIPNPDNLPEVNHKDGNKFNCRKDNLEWCTDRKNKNHALINNLYKKRSSKYYGVFYHKVNKKWQVSIRDSKSLKHVGTYKTEIEAAQAYNNYIIKRGLNRPLNKL